MAFKIPSPVRRIGRVILLLMLGYPHLIVVVPLLVGLSIHAISSLFGIGPPREWTLLDFIRGIGFATALTLFASLAVLYLMAAIYVGWKGHGALYRRRSWEAIARPWLHGVITRTNVLDRIEALASTHALVGPVARNEPACNPPVRYFYQPVVSASELALDFTYCVYGPKASLLPPHDTLLEFDRSNGHLRTAVRLEDRPTALIGVHPCDIHAIHLLDDVFSRDHRDEHYLSRRRHTFVVGIDCAKPCDPNVYCREMGANASDCGFDVMLYPLIDFNEETKRPNPTIEYGVVFATKAGRDWLSPNGPSAIRLPTVDDERRFEEYLEHKQVAFPSRLKKRRDQLPSMLAASYDSLVWEAAAQRCYSCGSCNLVCPTCYCFDINDEFDLSVQHGIRERTWDGCMLRDFAVVAGGHNFRSKPAQRLRHRVFRKASWIEQRTGLSGCVGCARCDRACTANISMVDILNQLAEEHEGAKPVPSGATQSFGSVS